MSSPRTGYATISTIGFEAISRPTSTFCTLPPDSLPTGVFTPGVTTCSSLDDVLGQRARRTAIRPEEAALLVAADHHVVHNIHRPDQTHAQSILRHEGELNAQPTDLNAR